MKNTCLLLFTDGREYLDKTLESFKRFLPWDFDDIILTDDSGNQRYQDSLYAKMEKFCDGPVTYLFHEERLGFARAIADTWKQIQPGIEWIFHLEDDYTLNRVLNLGDMIEIMKWNPHLVQLALMRQPWNEEEKRHGGIWQWHSTRGVEFTQKAMMGFASKPGARFEWYEHCGWMTTNPCLYPRWVADRGWPTDEGAGEGKMFRLMLQEDPQRRAAYFGNMQDRPMVEHIGHGRKGFGY
jgi:Glycosyl transferase family 2